MAPKFNNWCSALVFSNTVEVLNWKQAIFSAGPGQSVDRTRNGRPGSLRFMSVAANFLISNGLITMSSGFFLPSRADFHSSEGFDRVPTLSRKQGLSLRGMSLPEALPLER